MWSRDPTCTPGYHHDGFIATPELVHRMYGYTLYIIMLYNYVISSYIINIYNYITWICSTSFLGDVIHACNFLNYVSSSVSVCSWVNKIYVGFKNFYSVQFLYSTVSTLATPTVKTSVKSVKIIFIFRGNLSFLHRKHNFSLVHERFLLWHYSAFDKLITLIFSFQETSNYQMA